MGTGTEERTPDIPDDVQRAREEIARRAAVHRVGPSPQDRARAWILVASTWRLKLGGATTCAVCNRRCPKGHRDLCRDHVSYRFLWSHHSWHGEEQWNFTVRQLHDIAGLPVPEEYSETATEREKPD